MPTDSQMQFLIERAQKASDTNAQQLAKARAALAGAEAKYELLNRYRDDYQRQLGSSISNGTNSDKLLNFQRFIGNITKAVDQQRHEIEQRKIMVQRADTIWRESQRELQSYKTLVEREATRQRHREQKKEQKQNDEFATNNFLRIAREN